MQPIFNKIKANFQSGFTLIELMVVISIIGVLSSVVLVTVSDARTKAQIAKSLSFAQSVDHALGADAVAIYTFNDDTAKDLSGFGNNGTINGATPVSSLSQLGRAMSFDGNDYIEIPNSASLNLTQLTIGAWIKTPQNMGQSWAAIVGKQSGSDRDYNFYAFSQYPWVSETRVTNFHFSSNRFGSSSFSLPSPYAVGSWHYVSVTVDPTGLQKYYSDGVLFGTYQGTAGNANNNYPLWIGRADNYFNGLIDDVRIYSSALSQAQIRQHYVEGWLSHLLASK